MTRAEILEARTPMPSPTPSPATSAEPIARSVIAAAVFAAFAALGPIAMLVLYLVTHGVSVLSVDTAVILVVLASIYEVAISVPAALIAMVLVFVARRRGHRSKRVGGVALMILGITVSLFVLQILLYFSSLGSG